MKNNKGITLVSLIITIIVMVILAGIALVFSVGEGGIIERSQKAEVEQLLAKEKELVELAISDAKITTRNSVLTGNILTQALENQGLEPDRELSEIAPFIFKIKNGTGKEYCIMENGTEETIIGYAKDWKYNTLSDGTISITKCLLTDLNNITIPKYLIDENGNKLTVTGLGNNKIIYNDQGTVNDNIAEFKGNLILPNDVTIYRYAFYNCPEVEKVVIGDNTKFSGLCKGYEFNSKNIKLREVKIGKNVDVLYNIFAACPDLNKIVIDDNVILQDRAFDRCGIKNIEIGDNVTVSARSIDKSQYEIEKIIIGNNFIATGVWLNENVIKDIIIGNNASFADNGLMAQYNVKITGTVTFNGKIKNLGKFTLYGCTINAPNDCLEILDEGIIKYASLIGIKGINKIKLGNNCSFDFSNAWAPCIEPSEDITLECGTIAVGGFNIGKKTILPQKIEVLGNSKIDKTFNSLVSGYNSTLEEIILNPGVIVSNLTSYPKKLKITLKNVSEWDSELLASNKTVIETFGLTKYEEIDGNGVYTKP